MSILNKWDFDKVEWFLGTPEYGVQDIGQFSPEQKKELRSLVRNGVLCKVRRRGWNTRLRTFYMDSGLAQLIGGTA